ncbi:Peptidoglycan D,D-transpeptidase MrdA [bioreactor metagenome]|jgi:penicillin-binding protein 2|uniref:Peptidoglycan D,D-transpeptidase MrdA n=1 Tax=bioreactor metagenome TaxID=1076179 RepID=A0A644V503_9ZZZZ|nr:penicillin-binding protein 2 [Bacteroidales bacterium]MBP6453678.1 penicillin-binding protein 2 [Bacteroidales bacterium]MBP8677006.1 penicillin-binding protein 2 [Bacteroidales bacterium]MBP9978595.1 penicillin-binding protein 2 [Bacteroidales bacterium]
MGVELKDKRSILIVGLIVVAVVMILQLFNLQILDEQYKITASNNAFRYDVRYPARGIIYDRNGKILVGNATAYDIMITPYEVKELDTADLCEIFDLNLEDIRKTLADYRKNRRRIGYQSLPFVKQITPEQYSIFLEKSYKFTGFSAIPRTIRTYPYNACGNLLGYITEVDTAFIRKNPEYRRGDYVGKTGIEQSYEGFLKGEKGYNIFLRDVHNKVKSSFSEGKYDKEAIPGKNITSSIDAELQQYVESLMQNKIGSVVAIEPSTGEILTLVSSPGLEVSKLASISKYYNEIVNDPLKPMFNRAVMSPYPPGSVFKLVNGLIALQEGVIDTTTTYPCNMGYKVGRGIACHAHPSPTNLTTSIMMSCNAYYANAFRLTIDNPKYSSVTDAFIKWREYVQSFGFGVKLGSDLPGEQGGVLPSTEGYNKIHGLNRWKSLSIISLSIGQGELGTTPLHLANLAATIANRGYYHTPHIIKGAEDTTLQTDFSERHYTLVDTTNFKKIIHGMYLAVNAPPGSGATASRVAVPGLDICGKTGTAQNPHGKDHSVFICFAPRENPKIAVAAYIENSGFGGTWAAPIASLLVERYLKGVVERKDLEAHIISSNLIQNNKR